MHYWEQLALPNVITVFSAPNYCDCYKNKAAVIMLEGEDNFQIAQFEAVEKPYQLPPGFHAFNFSFPYLADMVMEIMHSILQKGGTAGGLTVDENLSDAQIKEMIESGNYNTEQIMKAKLQSVARVRRMYKTLKDNYDLFLQIKLMCDGKIPRGLLFASRSVIKSAIRDFEVAKNLDEQNEKRPKK